MLMKLTVQQQPKKVLFSLPRVEYSLPFCFFKPLFFFCIINNNSKLQNSTEENVIKLHIMPPKASMNSLGPRIKRFFNHVVNVEVSDIFSQILFPLFHLYF